MAGFKLTSAWELASREYWRQVIRDRSDDVHVAMQGARTEQLTCSKIRLKCSPLSFVAKHGTENNKQISHARGWVRTWCDWGWRGFENRRF